MARRLREAHAIRMWVNSEHAGRYVTRSVGRARDGRARGASRRAMRVARVARARGVLDRVRARVDRVRARARRVGVGDVRARRRDARLERAPAASPASPRFRVRGPARVDALERAGGDDSHAARDDRDAGVRRGRDERGDEGGARRRAAARRDRFDVREHVSPDAAAGRGGGGGDGRDTRVHGTPRAGDHGQRRVSGVFARDAGPLGEREGRRRRS